MQIDFHHAVTYILARLAGFPAEEASKVAYAAAYVDDTINDGLIQFTNKAFYSRISSAHRMMDPRNFRALANRFVWLPFHFLPGNGGKIHDQNPEGTFIQKLVCTQDSFVARDMVTLCINDAEKPYALHRLGITMHVFADAFSHQGFAGVSHEINEVSELDGEGVVKPKKSLQDIFNLIISFFVGKVLPLGHGAAITYPDLPYLEWQYRNGLGQKIYRKNPEIFIQAVESMFEAMVRFRMKNPHYMVTEKIPSKDLDQINKNIREFTDENGDIRHQKWINSIFNGEFSFAESGKEKIGYIPKGIGSWKYLALGTECYKEHKKDLFVYHKSFLTSDWKLFHDALQKHRLEVLHDILPKYGICAA